MLTVSDRETLSKGTTIVCSYGVKTRFKDLTDSLDDINIYLSLIKWIVISVRVIIERSRRYSSWESPTENTVGTESDLNGLNDETLITSPLNRLIWFNF